MQIRFTERFRRSYRELTADQARLVDKAIRTLAENPRHLGLRVKKMQGWEGIWEARASDALRLTFEMQNGALLLRNVGLHDDTLRNP